MQTRLAAAGITSAWIGGKTDFEDPGRNTFSWYVEGYTDTIACHQAGFTNAVATLGTALTKFHARRLERICSRVTLIFDGDTAGQRAADRAVEVFFGSNIDLAICTLPAPLASRPRSTRRWTSSTT